MNIPLNVDVYCTDGLAGHSLITISNPITNVVSHLVVVEGNKPYTKRLVPIKWVKNMSAELIRLHCTLAELASVDPLEKLFIHHAIKSAASQSSQAEQAFR